VLNPNDVGRQNCGATYYFRAQPSMFKPISGAFCCDLVHRFKSVIKFLCDITSNSLIDATDNPMSGEFRNMKSSSKAHVPSTGEIPSLNSKPQENSRSQLAKTETLSGIELRKGSNSKRAANLARIFHSTHKIPTACSRRREEADLMYGRWCRPPHVGGYFTVKFPG
jgi:hypothetical protein